VSRRLALALFMTTAMAALYADNFSFAADTMSGTMTKGRERTVLSGNARVISDSITITANYIELYGTDFRFAECSGKVSITDEEQGIHLTTEKLIYDRRDKLSRMTGPSTMEDKKNKVIIKGDFIENDDQRKIAIIQINVRILKENLVCRAEFARYNRETKQLELTGSPIVKRDGDDYKAARISVNLDTEDITLEGAVSGTVVQKKKEDTPEATAPQEVGAPPSTATETGTSKPQ